MRSARRGSRRCAVCITHERFAWRGPAPVREMGSSGDAGSRLDRHQQNLLLAVPSGDAAHAMPLEIEPPVRLAAYRTSLTTWVNGTKHEIAAADLNMTLLEWLRRSADGHEARLRRGRVRRVHGGRLELRRGGRGAAPAGGQRGLFPLCAVDWCAVTTIEGIGSTRKGLHPVQERMTEMHGSQCGFCTPGIVMAMYALFRTTPDLGVATLEEHMDGNLCRCTGYRPILDAADRPAPMLTAAVRRRRRPRRRRLRRRRLWRRRDAATCAHDHGGAEAAGAAAGRRRAR